MGAFDLLEIQKHCEALCAALPALPPNEMLRYLMEEHGIKQGELPEVGSQGVVSEILAGKRRLNTRQISALAKRFEVPGDLFI